MLFSFRALHLAGGTKRDPDRGRRGGVKSAGSALYHYPSSQSRTNLTPLKWSTLAYAVPFGMYVGV